MERNNVNSRDGGGSSEAAAGKVISQEEFGGDSAARFRDISKGRDVSDVDAKHGRELLAALRRRKLAAASSR